MNWAHSYQSQGAQFLPARCLRCRPKQFVKPMKIVLWPGSKNDLFGPNKSPGNQKRFVRPEQIAFRPRGQKRFVRPERFYAREQKQFVRPEQIVFTPGSKNDLLGPGSKNDLFGPNAFTPGSKNNLFGPNKLFLRPGAKTICWPEQIASRPREQKQFV